MGHVSLEEVLVPAVAQIHPATDQFQKINEELDEVRRALIEEQDPAHAIIELGDVIVACRTYMYMLGIKTQEEFLEVCRQVYCKNNARGYYN